MRWTAKAEIIGLYLNPPQHAAVFCVDEKTAIQALDSAIFFRNWVDFAVASCASFCTSCATACASLPLAWSSAA